LLIADRERSKSWFEGGSFALGAVVGLVLGIGLSIGTAIAIQSTWSNADSLLVADWQMLKLGMSKDEVHRVLREPKWADKLDEGIPNFAKAYIAPGHENSLALMEQYYYSHPAIPILLVFYDEKDRVVFVASYFS
jgi:hypothetical protein